MNTKKRRSELGQTLVLVAVAMAALLIFLALAIDIGLAYAERRHMQNAADAGALAGAWEMCFGTPANAAATARQYAVARNGADDGRTTVNIVGNHVEVVAGIRADTFIAGVIGITGIEIAAEAAAACGAATSACGFYPIAFSQERWDSIDCGDQFYVWNDSRFESGYIKIGGTDYPICDACECVLQHPPDQLVPIIAPGHRSWLLLPPPESPYPNPCTINCGSDWVRCWVQQGGYTGQMPLTDVCIPGQPGVAESVRAAFNGQINQTGNILLWEGSCEAGDEILGTCPGAPHPIVDAGCVRIVAVEEIDLARKPEHRPPHHCGQNIKVIRAEKLCDCNSACGTTIGDPAEPGQIRSVSLIR